MVWFIQSLSSIFNIIKHYSPVLHKTVSMITSLLTIFLKDNSFVEVHDNFIS